MSIVFAVKKMHSLRVRFMFVGTKLRTIVKDSISDRETALKR